MGYGIATGTGILRLYNNKHWLSDVVGGAGVGILSTKAAYFVYPKLKKSLVGDSYMFVPSYKQHGFGFCFIAFL